LLSSSSAFMPNNDNLNKSSCVLKCRSSYSLNWLQRNQKIHRFFFLSKRSSWHQGVFGNFSRHCNSTWSLNKQSVYSVLVTYIILSVLPTSVVFSFVIVKRLLSRWLAN
jgi:hypothetical protein